MFVNPLFQTGQEVKMSAVFYTLNAAIGTAQLDTQKYIFSKEVERCGKRIFLVCTKVCQCIN